MINTIETSKFKPNDCVQFFSINNTQKELLSRQALAYVLNETATDKYLKNVLDHIPEEIKNKLKIRKINRKRTAYSFESLIGIAIVLTLHRQGVYITKACEFLDQIIKKEPELISGLWSGSINHARYISISAKGVDIVEDWSGLSFSITRHVICVEHIYLDLKTRWLNLFDD